ncbi:MAG: effector binding domain-containing protein [Oscillospiraceae bacterium]|nr:effector binding domain-containing protein [Oscillospiraceae bacterium]
MFNYIADITLSEYIRKRKLSLAAIELQSSKERVIDLAIKYGYDSADSFTRAFVKQHGVTPTVARRQGTELVSFPPMTFQIIVEGIKGMNWRIEQKEAFSVLGIDRRFGNDETEKISLFWDECFKDGSLARLQEFVGRSELVGVCGHVDETKGDFRYMIGLVCEDIDETAGFGVIHAEDATWAVFRSEEFEENQYGQEIGKLFRHAYKEWLPSSGYEKVEGVDDEIYDMEIYGVTEQGRFYEEVWLSVTKK